MSLDDTLRWAERFPMRGRWPDTYGTPERDYPNYGWVHLWEAENPRPKHGEDFAEWHREWSKVNDRVWVAFCLPQFRVWDWSDEEIAYARALVRGHVCGVCGRPDDSGCAVGC